MPSDKKPVSIRPSSFIADLPDLSLLSLEEVVARFKDTEKKRSIRTEPDQEAEVHWMIRHAPVELISSIKVVSDYLGVSRAVLTKCMSRQVVDWYSNSLGLNVLSADYKSIYAKIKRKKYTTLRIQAENPSKFSFAQQPEEIKTSLCSINWVVIKLGEIGEVLGMTNTDLLLAGFCWSLTTLENSDWDADCIDAVFRPEANNISILIQDRAIDIRGLCAKFDRRETLRTGKSDLSDR